VSQEEQARYIPPSPSLGFWGFYERGAPFFYEPGRIDVDTVVRVETNLYSLRPDKLLWSAMTATVDPDNVRQLSSDVVGAVGEQLEDLGVLPAG
jgi:hypothetical protein